MLSEGERGGGGGRGKRVQCEIFTSVSFTIIQMLTHTYSYI